MDTLPSDLIGIIFSCDLSFRDALCCVQTCKSWRKALGSCGALWGRLGKAYNLSSDVTTSVAFSSAMRERSKVDVLLHMPEILGLSKAQLQKYPMNQCRVVCFGPPQSGKTCLVVSICTGHYVEGYDPTISDSYRKQFRCQCHSAYLLADMLDVPSQNEFVALMDQWIRNGDIFWITCTPNDFGDSTAQLVALVASVRDWTQEELHQRVILLLTKVDEVSAVELSAFQEMCLKMGLRFLCVSAKDKTNLDPLMCATLHMFSHATDVTLGERHRHNSKCCTLA